MVDVPPDLHLMAIKVKNKNGPEVRAMTPGFMHKALQEAEEYKGCYFAYWEHGGVKSLFVYRLDRTPNDEEVLPWAQELFNDGEIHRDIGPYHMWLVQGNVYTVETVADMVGKAFADQVAKTDSNADAFDFDKTAVGRKLSRKLRNGTN
jgi:hypothetical protein